MNETRDLLARVGERFTFPDDMFERLESRRDRKRRNKRIAAGVVGIAVFVAAVWIVTSVAPLDRSETSVVPGGGRHRTGGDRPAETGPTETGGENREPPPVVVPMPVGTLTRSGAGCALEIIGEPIPAGVGRLSVVNETNRRVSFELVRLDPEVLTFAQFEAIVRTDNYWHPRSETGWGWTSLIQREVGPTSSGTITDNFTTGDAFAVVCLNYHPHPDIVPDYKAFAVVGPIVVP